MNLMIFAEKPVAALTVLAYTC